jgi:hypothetical protein
MALFVIKHNQVAKKKGPSSQEKYNKSQKEKPRNIINFIKSVTFLLIDSSSLIPSSQM